MLDELIELGYEDVKVRLAQDENLGEARLEQLSKDPSDRVRSAVARQPHCPPGVLSQLSKDSYDFTRRGVASNPSADQSLLMELALDENQWVRYDVLRNPNASDDVRAAASLVSRPEQLQGPLGSQPDDEAKDPNTPVETLRSIAQRTLSDINTHMLRCSLAENPSLPDDLIPQLVDKAWWKGEWRAWWRRYSTQNWASTQAFRIEETEEWVIGALAEQGHPAALLRADYTVASVGVDPVQAVMELVDSELLVYALWRELALADVVELTYWRDTVEGDRFFAQASIAEGINLMPTGEAAERILGGWSPDRDWISLEDYMTANSVIRVLGMEHENWYEIAEMDGLDHESLDNFTLGGLAHLVENFRPSPVFQITQLGLERYEDVATERDFDPEDYDTEVTIEDPDEPLACYGATPESNKLQLVRLLQEARSNILIEKWGISNHFLKCIALHPETPKSILELLTEDADVQVRTTAQLALARS
ncbi:MAG: hypothetical protein B7C55_04545 [Actinomycetales bacterium mxb001]|nr:MAG: hypothetical protein B7C55_04545 [Actinomycetales bacterium mxb001]